MTIIDTHLADRKGKGRVTESSAEGKGGRTSRKFRRFASKSDDKQDSGMSDKRKRNGFRVGPKPAPGVYTGKGMSYLYYNMPTFSRIINIAADKIKASLIANAKIKQKYAKIVKQEGRAFPSSRRERHDGDRDGGDVDAAQASDTSETSARRPVSRKRPRADVKGIADEVDEDGPAPGPEASVLASAKVHPARRGQIGAKAATSRPIPEPAPSDRLLKRPRLTETEVQERRDARERNKAAWTKKARTGQPNLVSGLLALAAKLM